MAKIVPRPNLSFWESIYFVEILKGLFTTIGHAKKSLVDPGNFPTLNYPEEAPRLPQDYRARHRLMKRPDGNCSRAASFLGWRLP